MKKPKKLYRYDLNKRLQVHFLEDNCIPQKSDCPQGEQESLYLNFWRCRHGDASYHDFYGFSIRADAKLEEIRHTGLRITQEKMWLEKLTEN